MEVKIRRMKKCIFITNLIFLILISAANVYAQDKKELNVALLPILDSLPFYVAEEKGYFDDIGATIKSLPAASGLDRDQLMQSGEIDAMLTEMTTTAMYNRKKINVKILRIARMAYKDYPLFRILAAPGTTVSSPADIAGVPIAVSKNTIIEYMTDRVLESGGLKPSSIKKQSVPVIPERYMLLMQGKIKCATLPDPLAKSALDAGAVLVIDDSSFPQYSVSVLSFSSVSIKNKPDLIKQFLCAWDKAASDINDNPEEYRPLLLKKIRVPKNVQKTYKIPRFARNGVPSEKQWGDVMDWMIEKGLLKKPLPYSGSISGAMLTGCK